MHTKKVPQLLIYSMLILNNKINKYWYSLNMLPDQKRAKSRNKLSIMDQREVDVNLLGPKKPLPF